MTLDPKWKAKWIEALRFGRYAQGTGYLRTDQGFCCLGVLCDVVDSTKWRKESATIFNYVFDSDCEQHGSAGISYLPPDIAQQASLSAHAQTALANMNDNGRSFEKIAAYIEEHL